MTEGLPSDELGLQHNLNPADPEYHSVSNELATTLYENTLLLGDVRSFGTTTLHLGRDQIQRLFPDAPSDADYVQIPSYQKFDHCIFLAEHRQAGLTVSSIFRNTYHEVPAEYEPLHLGVGLENESGSVFVDFEVPMPDDSVNKTPPKPVRVTVSMSEGADMASIVASSQLMLETSALDPDGSAMTPAKIQQVQDALTFFEGLMRGVGTQPGQRQLDTEAVGHLERWANLYFLNEPPTTDPSQIREYREPVPQLTEDEESTYQADAERLGKMAGVHYTEKDLSRPLGIEHVGRFTGQLEYLKGCRLDAELLAKEARAIAVTVAEPTFGIEYRVTVSPTIPDEPPIPRAGEPNRYLLRIVPIGPDGLQHVPTTHRYLSSAELRPLLKRAATSSCQVEDIRLVAQYVRLVL